MAKKTELMARVLRSFRDKHTGEIHVRGSEFSTDEKRVKEINAGREYPLVEIVEGTDAASVKTSPAASATNTEQNDTSGAQAGTDASAPGSVQPDAKGNGE